MFCTLQWNSVSRIPHSCQPEYIRPFICNKPQLCSLDVLSEKFSLDHYPLTMCILLQHDKLMTAGSDIEYFSKSSFDPDIFNEYMLSDELLLSTF